MSRGRKWVKEKKKELKAKFKTATKSEKVQLVKQHLDNIYDSYSNFIGLIPDVEKRIEELKGDESGVREAWEDVLKCLKNVKNKPRAMKLMYAKKVTGKMKKLRKKYPNE